MNSHHTWFLGYFVSLDSKSAEVVIDGVCACSLVLGVVPWNIRKFRYYQNGIILSGDQRGAQPATNTPKKKLQIATVGFWQQLLVNEHQSPYVRS